MVKIGRRGKKQWDIANNGEIVFTYKEAKEKCCISTGAFRTAIDDLREKGFIDIAATGMGVYKVTTLYSISNRWKLYGTPEYEPPKPRPKKPVNRGFRPNNQYGRNCRKKISTVTGQHSTTVTGQHSKVETNNSYVDLIT